MKIFKKRKQKQEQRTAPPVYNVISFSIEQEQQGNIVLGKRKDEIFIHFRNPDLAAFFTDWFSMLKLHRDNQLSDAAYNQFVDTAMKQAENR